MKPHFLRLQFCINVSCIKSKNCRVPPYAHTLGSVPAQVTLYMLYKPLISLYITHLTHLKFFQTLFFSVVVRTLIKEKIATVGVGYPATPLTQGRIRVCISAGHTKEQLDYALDVIERVADQIGIKYSRKPRDLRPIDYDNIKLYHDD